MRWMLARAGGGDVVVIRASGSNGYNSYFFSELGVPVNSVETIRFDNGTAAYDPYVIQRIRGAELLFIAGGDQYKYYQYWRDTPIEDAINYLIQEKKITIGGTSAGMAILGRAYYCPPGASLESVQALSNPFHPNTAIIGKDDFIAAPFMDDLITDTHYDQRDRQGRHFTFLARLVASYQKRAFGIACNEYTAVCIDESGIGRVFGEYPEFDDFAYFLKSNCQEPFGPEQITEGLPLTWNRGQGAVQVYKLPGNTTGSHTFNLNDWTNGVGGAWENWYVEQGVMMKTLDAAGDCPGPLVETTAPVMAEFQVHIAPNPFTHYFLVSHTPDGPCTLQILDYNGRIVWEQAASVTPLTVSHLDHLPAGAYALRIRYSDQVRVVKINKL
jgi:cyanophycinase-like exopeptidase